MMTEVCGAMICCIMLEMGRATSHMMKVHEATKNNSVIVSSNFDLCGNRYETVYLLMKEVCEDSSHNDGGGIWWYQLCDVEVG